MKTKMWRIFGLIAMANFILSLYQLVLEIIGKSLWMNWYHIRMSIILLIIGWIMLGISLKLLGKEK